MVANIVTGAPKHRRVFFLCGLAIVVGALAAGAARALSLLIDYITGLAFHGASSFAAWRPFDHDLGAWVIAVPAAGGVLVGLIARYGSPAIRGHGIPEAMERVLFHESRIAPRLALLKPLSAAISIGTGGPFGSEGPIIATGGAIGSTLGQLLPVSAAERKVLLAAGAAAGMAATFGTPVAAVLLAVELLLFEYQAQSIIPVALAAGTAASLRIVVLGGTPVFPMHGIVSPRGAALACYIALGLPVGLAASLASRLIYAVEDAFERLPIHWMWWPALGGLCVGTIGWLSPHTLGVGYENIRQALTGELTGTALALLCAAKLVSWAIALGSGTSGGTLAPLLTVGAGLGALLGAGIALIAPSLGVDPRVAALVGMAALFSGASRALLASVVFAFELTREPLGLLPVLGACATSTLIAAMLHHESIMTEKIARRGALVPSNYIADVLAHCRVGDFATTPARTLPVDASIAFALSWFASGVDGTAHQGYPVVAVDGSVLGVVTRRELLRWSGDPESRIGEHVKRSAIAVSESATLRTAADLMVHHEIGRLPVIDGAGAMVGMLTRSDLLRAHEAPLRSREIAPPAIVLPKLRARASA